MKKYREHELKAAIMKRLRALRIGGQWPNESFRHEDKMTHGLPDISVNALKRTVWWEVKHANPSFEHDGIQDLTCQRLARHTYCRHLIFVEPQPGFEERCVLIVRPANISLWRTHFEACIRGFDFEAVVAHMIEVQKHL